MPEITLHDVDPSVIRRLTDLAARTGRTVEQEAKLLLEESVGLSRQRAAEAARRIRESHGRKFTDSADLIREDRDR